MSDSSTRWPRKTHELHNHHFDSTVWNDFKFRDDDIVITTYGKSGTTWLEGGGQTFINKSVNGRWRDVLSEEAIGRYDKIARRELGEPCSDWLAQQ